MASAQPVRVAIDVETTGLQVETDSIIEVGAVKFRGDEILETFQSLIETRRPVPYRIQRLTNITPAMLAGAPTFGVIAPGLRVFLGALPLVGHSVGFDAGFLRKMRVAERNTLIDTFELASLLLPALTSYSLEMVASALAIASSPEHHRALADALLARDVLLALERRIALLSDPAVNALCELATPAVMPAMALVRAEQQARGLVGGRAARATVGNALSARLHRDPAVLGTPVSQLGNPAPRTISPIAGDRPTPQSGALAECVTTALDQGECALVELAPGATGVDAALRPALAWALAGDRRIVIAAASMSGARALAETHLPRVLASLGESSLTVATLFEPHDYLCPHRWFGPARSASGLSPDGLRGLAKLTHWLYETEEGARDEISLNPTEQIAWETVRADAQALAMPACAYRDRDWCFAGRARESAAEARVVVTTHAALLATPAAPMGQPPQAYVPAAAGYVMLDAGQLEDRGTTQESVTLDAESLLVGLNLLWRRDDRSASGLLARAARELPAGAGEGWANQTGRAREAAVAFFDALATLLAEPQAANQPDSVGAPVRLDDTSRSLHAWGALAEAWNALARRLATLADTTAQAAEKLKRVAGADALSLDLAARAQWLRQIARQGAEIITQPRDDRVYWARPAQSFNRFGARGRPAPNSDEHATLHSAPARVAPIISAALRRLPGGVAVAGTALAVDGRFDDTAERLGLPHSLATARASVDFSGQTLILIPSDAPEPNMNSYQRALGDTLTQVATALGGRTVALFTSHTGLRTVYTAIKPALEACDILVLAQGIDGSLRQLWQNFRAQERVVLLGAGGIWDGWESDGARPGCVFVARLPLPTMSDPLIAARTEGLADAMRQFLVPHAALRLRRALNRLAWEHASRNVIVLYDRRVVVKEYGATIMHTLPPASQREESVTMLGAVAREWLDGAAPE